MTYRILITGSRTWTDDAAVWEAITATIDAHAAAFCEDQSGWYDNAGYTLAEERHSADWATCTSACPQQANHRRTGRGGYTYCPLAGHHRNQHMVDLGADILLAFIRGNSRGATDCAQRARAAGIEVKEWRS